MAAADYGQGGRSAWGRRLREILVTGGKGQLGTELRRHPWPAGWDVVAVDVDELDLTDTTGIAALVASRPWAAVISGAAYTAVDKAEGDPVTAWTVNAVAPAAFALACATADVPLLQVSTDYVFDGSKPGGWEVDDPTGPLNVYGATKLGGELAVRTACKRHAIVRTSWVISAHGANFVKTMLRLGGERQQIDVVSDQYGAPTGAADLAAALAIIAMRIADDPTIAGTWHFSNAGATTWYDVARETFVQAARHGFPAPKITAITTADYPVPAARPAYSLLSHAAITRDFGIVPRPWQEAVADIVDELYREE